MKRMVTLLEMVPRERRCIVECEAPLILRYATWRERLQWWFLQRKAVCSSWIEENTHWRARKAARKVIERAKA